MSDMILKSTITAELPSNGLKPASNPRYKRGDIGDVLTCATRVSAYTGKPMYISGQNYNGYKIHAEQPSTWHLAITASYDKGSKVYTVTKEVWE